MATLLVTDPKGFRSPWILPDPFLFVPILVSLNLMMNSGSSGTA